MSTSYEQYALEMMARSIMHVPGVSQLYFEAAWHEAIEEKTLSEMCAYERTHKSIRTKEYQRIQKNYQFERGEKFGLCMALATIASHMGDGFDSVAQGFIHQEVWKLVNQAELETRQTEQA